MCLTEQRECCRLTAVRLRDYLMQLTLSEKNALPNERTPKESVRRATSPYFQRARPQ